MSPGSPAVKLALAAPYKSKIADWLPGTHREHKMGSSEWEYHTGVFDLF